MRALVRAFALGAVIASQAVAAQSASGHIKVLVEGVVDRAGEVSYPSPVRLSAVALAAGVKRQAYILGGAWLRLALKDEQLKLRTGLLFELSAIQRKGLASQRPGLAENAARLRQWLATLPITGRRTATVLDPYRLEVTPTEDWLVADGDQLVYPNRPSGIRVVGAVNHSCQLPIEPLQDARRYLASCPLSDVADKNHIFVIQPDGMVYEEGIALWNRDESRSLAPGAWIYVPLDERIIDSASDESFNRDFANFLATQLSTDEAYH